MNFDRVRVIATNVFREVIRDRILYLIVFFAILMVAVAGLLPEVAAGTEDKISLDFGLAAITALSVLVAIFVGTGLINKEIEKRTILALIAKPISPIEFIVGKHLGLSGVLAVLLVAMTAIYLGVLSLNAIPFSTASIILTALYLFLELCLIAAAAMMFGVFTSSLLATLLTFGVYLMGHLSRDLVALGNLTENSNIQRLTRGLYLILPDLARLDLKNQAVYGLELLPSPLQLLSHAGYGLFYTVLLLAIAVLIFSRREF